MLADWIPSTGVAIVLPSIAYVVGSRQIALSNDLRLKEFEKRSDLKFETLRSELELRFSILKNELIEYKRLSDSSDGRRDGDFKEAAVHLREISEQMARVTEQVSSIVREQNVVNQMTGKALDGIMNRLEEQADQTTANTSNISLIRELLSKQLSQLGR